MQRTPTGRVANIGIVGPSEGSKAREVLVTSEFQLEEMLGNASPTMFADDE